ncbi:MAG: S-layer homology domain-containing protein [Ruminococcus sp.]|nr:S-layer homology domain-containing protein [Ruminococcus sp.]
MKKLPALFLIFVMLIQLCIFNVNADITDELQIKATQYVAGTPAQKGSSGNDALMYVANKLGYDINATKPSSAIIFSFRSGIADQGIVEVRLGSTSGTIIGTVDTSKVGAPDWKSHRCIINLNQPLVGEQRIFFCVKDAGPHWFEGFSLIPDDNDDNSKRFIQYKDLDNFTDIEDDPNRHEINVLSDLGLILKDKTEFNSVQPMNRVDFVSAIGRLVEAEKYVSNVSPFKDIQIKDENFNVLCGLYQLGIIKGDTEGNFRPKDFIKPYEAATVCINALGYNVFAKDVNGVLDIANKINLFDRVNVKNSFITRTEGVRIIYNLLLSDYLAIGEFGSNSIVYNPTQNFLNKSAKLIHDKGVMTSNGITGLYSRKKSEGISIDGIKYTAEDSVNVDFLGILCEFIYREEDGERVLCAIRPLPKVEVNVVTSSTDIKFEKINEREIIYTKVSDGEEIEYELAADSSIIYNGTALEGSLASVISNPSNFEGDITLIDNNADGICECVWIDHVSRVIKFGGVATSKINDLFTYTNYDITEGDFWLFIGTGAATLGSLMRDDIITVYESSDSGKNKFVRAVVKRLSVSGTISQISSNGEIIINDEAYKVSAMCTDEMFVGLKGEFILDNYSQVVGVEKAPETKPLIGGFLGSDAGESSALNSKARAKLYTGKAVVEFDFAKRVVADGVVVKNIEDIYNGKGTFVGISNVDENTPVLYRINANNEITMIDTVLDGAKNDDDCLTRICAQENFIVYNSVLNSESPILQFKYAVSNKAKLLILPLDKRVDKYSLVDNFTSKYSGEKVEVAAYTTNRNSMIADLVVSTNADLTGSELIGPFVVKSITETLSEDDAIVPCINGVVGNGNVKYVVDEASYNSDTVFKKTV